MKNSRAWRENFKCGRSINIHTARYQTFFSALQDVQWNDIDYMERNNDFTIDPVNFAELPQLIDDIHAAGMHYVAMLDPGISGSEPEGTYAPYTDGVAMDVLVKNSTGNIFIGHVWNDADTVYPDFTHPRIEEYWTKQLREFHNKIAYDALWIVSFFSSSFFFSLAGLLKF